MDQLRNAGRGRPSIRDVARMAGVSPGCVSNVLNRRRSQTDRIGSAVLQAVSALGYRTNPIASNLRRATSRFIGVVIPDFENPFFGQLVAELERCAEGTEYRIVAASSRESGAIEAREITEFLDWRVAGLLLAPATDSDAATRPDTADVPLVLMDRHSGDRAQDEVGVNNFDAARAVTARLVAAGHREILVAYSRTGVSNVDERLGGARAGIAAAPGARMHELACGHTTESSAAAFAVYLSARRMPDAIFGLNNLATLAALGAVQRRGLAVARDVALVSFDDSAWMAHMYPRIAAVVQPVPQIARAAWSCLMQRIGGDAGAPRQIMLECLLDPRDTMRAMTEVPIDA